MNGEEDEARERRSRGPDQIPTEEPRPRRDDGLRELAGAGLPGEEDDRAAVGAAGEVRERLLLLMRRQGVLGEGAELVCVGVVAGLEEVFHSVFTAQR